MDKLKTIKNQVNDFEKKRASSSVTEFVTASVPTENNITAYVPTDDPVTAYVPTKISYVPTDNPVSASVPTDYPISDSNVASRKKGVNPKGTINEKKRGTKISIANYKNEIAHIVYRKKT